MRKINIINLLNERSSWIKRITILLLSLFVSVHATALLAKPNVVMIVLDDMGYGYLRANFEAHQYRVSNDIRNRDQGLYNFDLVHQEFNRAMPTLNAMVDSGVRFSDAYTTSSLCGPSRLSILTGVHNAQFGRYTNVDINRVGLPKSDEYNWPIKDLSTEYQTAAIGKWHARSNRYTNGDDPISVGFENFYGFIGHGTPYYGSEKIHRYNKANNTYEQVPQPAGAYLTDVFTDETLKMIDANTGMQPLFLYLSYNAIHGPLGKAAPAVYQQQFNTGYKAADTILAYLLAVDVGIKKIMDKLATKGQLENTVFLFIADNGSPGGYKHPSPSNSPFDGFKGQILNGGLRIPMVAYQKGTTQETVYPYPVSAMDLMPTVMQYAGYNPDDYGMDGRSLISIINGLQTTPLHKYLFAAGQNAVNSSLRELEHADDRYHAPGAWMVRANKWVLFYTADTQYIDTAVRAPNKAKLALYKASDTLLQNDLSAKKTKVVNRLKNAFEAWFDANTATPIVSGTAEFQWWPEVQP